MPTILDVFCEPGYRLQRFELMRRQVYAGDEEGNPSLWDMILENRYSKYMPKPVSRRIEYSIHGPRSDLNMLFLHFWYFLMLGHEPSCQRIVVEELKEDGDYKRAEFFSTVFILEIQLYYDILFSFYTHDTIASMTKVMITKLKVSWQMQSPHNFIVTQQEERVRIEHDRQNLMRIREERSKKKKVPSMARIRKKAKLTNDRATKKLPKLKKSKHVKAEPVIKQEQVAEEEEEEIKVKKEPRAKKTLQQLPRSSVFAHQTTSEERAIAEGIIAPPKTQLGYAEFKLLRELRRVDAIAAKKSQ